MCRNIHSFILPSILSFIYPYIHSPIHLPTYPFIHAFIHYSIHLSNHSFIHLFIHFFFHNLLLHLFIQRFKRNKKMFLIHPLLKLSFVESLLDREVAGSASDLQSLNFKFCVWRAVSSHNPQEVLLALFSMCAQKWPKARFISFPSIYSFIHEKIISLTHLFIHSSIIHPSIHSPIHLFIHPSIHPSINSPIHLFINSFQHAY